MAGGLQIFEADGTVVLDTNSRTGIILQTINVPRLPWVSGRPLRHQDFTVKTKRDSEEFFFVVLGSGDYDVNDPFNVSAYTVGFSTINNSTVRVTRQAADTPAMSVLVGIVGK